MMRITSYTINLFSFLANRAFILFTKFVFFLKQIRISRINRSDCSKKGRLKSRP